METQAQEEKPVKIVKFYNQYVRESIYRYIAKRKAMGLPPARKKYSDLTEEQKEKMRAYDREYKKRRYHGKKALNDQAVLSAAAAIEAEGSKNV